MVLLVKSNEAMGMSHEPKSRWMQTVPQVLAVSVKNILLLAFGMTLGFPTILIPGLLKPDEPFRMTAEEISWIGSVNLICVPIGSIVSGAVSQAIGRKRAMQVVNIPFVFAWLLFRFSDAEWQVFVALAMTGLSGGFLEAPVLTYVAEITQPRLRGVLSSTSSMAVIGGVLIMFLLGTFFPWRTVALISCIFNVMSFTFLFFVPESPHWLISNNRLLDARKSIAWLRGWTDLDEIEPEYKQIYREVKAEDEQAHGQDNPAFAIDGNANGMVAATDKAQRKQRKRSKFDTLRLFLRKNFLWPFALVCTVFFVVHMTGMTTLQTYAVPMFQSVNAPIDKYYATVMLGCVELLGSICSTALVHYTGKRLLNFISILGVGACFAVVGVYAQLNGLTELVLMTNEEYAVNNSTPSSVEFETTTTAAVEASDSWVPLTFLIGVAFMSHLGIRILPWILTGEVFSNETRAAAAGLCSAFTYIISFGANKAFFGIVGLLTLPGTFFAHSVMALLGFVFLYFCLPETEGKTLGQINVHFAGGEKMGDKVHRSRGRNRTRAVQMPTSNSNGNGVSNEAYRQSDVEVGDRTESRF